MKRLVSILLVVVLLTGTAYAINAVSVSYPILVNGSAMTFDVQPVNINGRTLLPLRAISEAVGVPITWNQAKGQVEIQTIDTEALKDACVMIYSGKDGKYTEQGSGVLIDYDEILTCWHVVDDSNSFKAFYDDGTTQLASLTDYASSEDAATLKPNSMNVKPVKIGDSDSVKVGDTVYVVSSPSKELNVVEKSSVTKTNSSVNYIMSFQIDPVTSIGSSGGAVFNSSGEIIGIVQAGDENTTAVIPINDIRQSLAS